MLIFINCILHILYRFYIEFFNNIKWKKRRYPQFLIKGNIIMCSVNKIYLICNSTYCENGNCTKQYQHIWRDHQKMLWNTWFIALHSNWRGEVNTKQQNTYEWIQFVSNLLESMIEANKLLNIELHNNDFNEEIKSFRDDISLIKEKVRSLIY